MAPGTLPRPNRKSRAKFRPVAFGYCCAALAACLAGPAGAATITVDTAADSDTVNGACSLREAVDAANDDTAMDGCEAGSGDDTITFAPALIGQTITLVAESADLDLGNNNFQNPASLDIVGPVEGDASSIVIEAGENGGRVFDVEVETALSTLRLANLTVQKGFVAFSELDAEGGGIRIANNGNTQLILQDVRISNNNVESLFGSAYGGGVYVEGPFTLIRTAIVGNTAATQVGEAEGAGLWYEGSASALPRQILASEISANTAIATEGGSAQGGGLYLDSSSQPPEAVQIANTTISGNVARASSGQAGAAGGGVYALGGGINLFFNNVTIAANVAENTAQATASTGGGLLVFSATALLSNTLIATNNAANAPDCFVVTDTTSMITSAGFNLIGNADGCFFQGMASDLVGSATAPLDAQLGALADNGGPTRTHALMAASPAVDAGSQATPGAGEGACEQTDQRGAPRPEDGNGNGAAVCDIGAFEKAANEAPILVRDIPNQNLQLAGDTLDLDLNNFFEDPEGQPISFTAESSNPAVATVSVISQVDVLTITAVSPGTTTVTVTASDSTGQLRVARVPVTGTASRTGGLSASSGGGCALAAGPVRFDPLLWLMLAAFAGWRLRRRRARVS